MSGSLLFDLRSVKSDLAIAVASESPLLSTLQAIDTDAPLSPASEITPNLWLGNVYASRDKRFFESKGIKAVLNCSSDIPRMFRSTAEVEYVRIPIEDDATVEGIDLARQYIPVCVELLHKWLCIEKVPVLVHCWAGRQRSASMVVAFLVKYGNLSLLEALRAVLRHRPEAFHFGTSINFEDALVKWDTAQA